MQHHIQVDGIAAHPSMPYYLTPTSDGHVLLWQFGQSACTFTYSSHNGRISSVSFDSYGCDFAISNAHGPVSVYKFHSTLSSSPSSIIQCHSKSTFDLQYLCNSSTLFSTCGHSLEEKSVRVWDMLLPPQKSCVLNYGGHLSSDPRKLIYDECNNRIIAGCHKGEIGAANG
jgi:WD40 repeat protein